MKDKWEREMEQQRDCHYDRLNMNWCLDHKKDEPQATIEECIECSFRDLFKALDRENLARATMVLFQLREIVRHLPKGNRQV